MHFLSMLGWPYLAGISAKYVTAKRDKNWETSAQDDSSNF